MNPRSLFLVPLAMVIMAMAPAHGQVTMSCTPAMMSSFTPCLNFVTNSSSSNGTIAPTSDCCTSLRNVTNGGLACMCLLVSGRVPFQIPINRTLAISLPRACNMPGIPIQCKATGAPIPAPGPSSFTPALSPASSPTPSPPTPSPTGSSVPQAETPSLPQAETPSLPPESDTTPALTPPSTATGSNTPTSTTGSRSKVTPSGAGPSYALSPAVLLLLASASALFYYH